ncbi:hypothetical protein [Streptosporangium sp. NPDC023615]|uniref:hypothetical protein n=1 Tax=Streptosporangium sp. NPDC023615 TaxID=3154794 RepID=UPI0034126389
MFQPVPPAVEYGLTPLGTTLLEPLSAMADRAVRHAPETGEARSRRAPAREDLDRVPRGTRDGSGRA